MKCYPSLGKGSHATPWTAHPLVAQIQGAERFALDEVLLSYVAPFCCVLFPPLRRAGSELSLADFEGRM